MIDLEEDLLFSAFETCYSSALKVSPIGYIRKRWPLFNSEIVNIVIFQSDKSNLFENESFISDCLSGAVLGYLRLYDIPSDAYSEDSQAYFFIQVDLKASHERYRYDINFFFGKNTADIERVIEIDDLATLQKYTSCFYRRHFGGMAYSKEQLLEQVGVHICLGTQDFIKRF